MTIVMPALLLWPFAPMVIIGERRPRGYTADHRGEDERHQDLTDDFGSHCTLPFLKGFIFIIIVSLRFDVMIFRRRSFTSALRHPLTAMAKQVIRILFLIVRHAGIELFEDRDEILKSIGMGLGDFAVGLEIFDRGPVLCLFMPGLV
jgi:hypothetical protein